MLEQVRQVGHHLRQRAGLFANPHHAAVQFAEEPRVLSHGGGKRGAPPDRLRNVKDDLAQAGVFLLLSEAVERLRDRDRRAQQRAHLTREGRDRLLRDPA